jgi:hypothetical protein
MNNPAITNLRRNRAIVLNDNLINALLQNTGFKITLLFAAHVLLAVVTSQFRPLATLHALATLAVGFWLAATSRQPEKITLVAAYITGSEVLWRMTQAQVFWEFGKYSVVAILALAMLRTGQLRGFTLPFLYFALLLPSTVFPMENVGTDELRGHLSFNLSGPLALTVCAWYFSQIRLPLSAFYRALLFLVAPIIGIGTLTLMGTFKASVLRFGNESNFVTSGGFGPNQVSAILGLGVLAIFLYLLVEKRSPVFKSLLFALLIGMAAQSAMTFSRTGLYNAAVSAVAGTFYLVRDRRARLKLLGLVVCGFLVANYVLLPRLEQFTSGTLLKRFQSTSLTGRDAIIRADLQIWSDNPVFGVGPGQAAPYRAMLHREAAAHTEFSRMLAEHGVFGFLALLLLSLIGYRNLRRARDPKALALAAALTCWGFGFMLVTAMRLVAPAVILGLGSILLYPDEPEPDAAERPSHQ